MADAQDVAPTFGFYMFILIGLLIGFVGFGCRYVFCVGSSLETQAQATGSAATSPQTGSREDGVVGGLIGLTVAERKALVANVLKTKIMTTEWAHAERNIAQSSPRSTGIEAHEIDQSCDTVDIRLPKYAGFSIENLHIGDNPKFLHSPTCSWKDTSQLSLQCAICLEPLLVGHDIGFSHDEACAHIFHKACISEWLFTHHDCPICRRQFLAISTS